MFTVSYNDATGTAHRVELGEGETLIGRATNCHIVLNVASVSRHHARLRVSGDRCTLSDAGSTYGTHLNGAPLTGEAPLKAGDTFHCGVVAFTFEQIVSTPPLLADNHELLQDSASIVLRIDDAALGIVKEGSAVAPAGHPIPDASAAGGRPEERRGAPDRRRAQVPFSGPDRRSGRDRRQRRLLRLLSEISKTLVEVLPLGQVLSRVVDLVFEVVPAERTFLLLRDSADEGVTARVRRARDGSTPESTLSRTIINTVMREHVAMLADDARYDARLGGVGSIHAMVNIRSFMCAPLWNRNEVIGVLYTDNPRSKRFVPEDLDVFAALANYAAVAIEQARMTEQLQIEMQRRERLSRYHSPSVVNRILSGTEPADAGFETAERDLSVMFTDLVGFTTRSENMAPIAVSRLLNHFFAQMADQLFEFDGTLDKFIGDGILAVFGAPLPQPDHADRAIEAALGMRAALARINRELAGDPLQMRTALHSGVALTGDIGSPRRREFTVLGDVVNACSRLESTVCKPGQIVCTRATLDRANKSFNTKSLGMVSLRGRQGEVEVFEIN